eukprot:1161907-Pelagomonas_calceolata.AAC.6
MFAAHASFLVARTHTHTHTGAQTCVPLSPHPGQRHPSSPAPCASKTRLQPKATTAAPATVRGPQARLRRAHLHPIPCPPIVKLHLPATPLLPQSRRQFPRPQVRVLPSKKERNEKTAQAKRPRPLRKGSLTSKLARASLGCCLLTICTGACLREGVCHYSLHAYAPHAPLSATPACGQLVLCKSSCLCAFDSGVLALAASLAVGASSKSLRVGASVSDTGALEPAAFCKSQRADASVYLIQGPKGASESVAYLMKSEEKDARIHWLPREVETGNIEYKYRLCSPSPMRMQQLGTVQGKNKKGRKKERKEGRKKRLCQQNKLREKVSAQPRGSL